MSSLLRCESRSCNPRFGLSLGSTAIACTRNPREGALHYRRVLGYAAAHPNVGRRDGRGASRDDRGRLTLSKEIRERHGDRYHIVERHDGSTQIPVADGPIDALHLLESDGDTVVSSDGWYEGFAPRLDPEASSEE
ncbi:hypothetical protein U4E84_15415 [Halorubrum sp. AD140]|uniref:hypothetical protein n=1 Tax=Halorubrum sp. AD140 TaxID=3050073 RepID=UPI002ACCC257|nr:hypothetical protein [Halorubrum sp. AD140]MDZ5812733.1 hypothetical protein [Halorubrum sp. AD140]